MKKKGAAEMAKNYVFSTLANDQLYTNWLQGGGDMPIKGHSVLIKGGTGVANDRLITPLGVATEISDYDLEELQKNPSFKHHEANGFIVVRNKKAEAEKVASDMNLKDESAPLTDADYTNAEDAPKLGK
jgi:hypothetical protein